MDHDCLFTAKEVAEYLKLSTKTGHRTVIRWVKRGELKSIRAGNLYRFRKEDLETFLFIHRKGHVHALPPL